MKNPSSTLLGLATAVPNWLLQLSVYMLQIVCCLICQEGGFSSPPFPSPPPSLSQKQPLESRATRESLPCYAEVLGSVIIPVYFLSYGIWALALSLFTPFTHNQVSDVGMLGTAGSEGTAQTGRQRLISFSTFRLAHWTGFRGTSLVGEVRNL